MAWAVTQALLHAGLNVTLAHLPKPNWSKYSCGRDQTCELCDPLKDKEPWVDAALELMQAATLAAEKTREERVQHQ